MSPVCLVVLTGVIYLLLVVISIAVTVKKVKADELILLSAIIIGALSLIACLVCFFIYQNSEYLSVLFALFFIYVFFTNIFKQDNNYEVFGIIFFKHLGWIVLELVILIGLTNLCEKKTNFIKNIVIGELVFPIGISIILYTVYLFVDLMKRYESKFLYCKMITLLTFYINIIAVLFLVQIKIDNLNAVISAILVVLSLLMNFIDKSEQFNYYFRTDGKIKNIENNLQ